MRHLASALALLLAVTTSSARAAAQQPSAARAADEPGLVGLAELVLDQYAVQNVDPGELADLATELIGRSFRVKENAAVPVRNLRQLGGSIVVYDTKAQVERTLALLAKLDVDRNADTQVETLEYKPRFVSLDMASESIAGLVLHEKVQTQRGLLVLHDRQPAIDAALELLKRVDVPEKQVLLTCQLIDVGESARGQALPRELNDNLQRLLPDVAFAQVGMAMLKTSVTAAIPVSVEIESTGKRYRFSFLPVAYDEASGSLSVAHCSLIEQLDGGSRELFNTSTVLRGGEHTVLAATGATPRLLVVRVTQQG
jgi:hypothetical protein